MIDMKVMDGRISYNICRHMDYPFRSKDRYPLPATELYPDLISWIRDRSSPAVSALLLKSDSIQKNREARDLHIDYARNNRSDDEGFRIPDKLQCRLDQ